MCITQEKVDYPSLAAIFTNYWIFLLINTEISAHCTPDIAIH